MKDGCFFRSPNFLIVGLSNSPVNYWFDIISLLAVPPDVFSFKKFVNR